MIRFRDLCCYELGSRGVVFDEPSQQLFAVNHSATIVLSNLIRHTCIENAIGAIAAQLDISDEVAQTLISEVSTQLESFGVGFQADPTDFQRQRPSARKTSGPCTRPPTHGRGAVTKKTYQLMHANISVEFSGTYQLNIVHPVLAHLESEGNTCSVVTISGRAPISASL